MQILLILQGLLDIVRRMNNGIASTSKNNRSKVIYCFDCDDYDIKQEDADFLSEAGQYCKEKDYEFVWFCKDVECAYLGKKVDAGQKSKEAGKFKAKKINSKC